MEHSPPRHHPQPAPPYPQPAPPYPQPAPLYPQPAPPYPQPAPYPGRHPRRHSSALLAVLLVLAVLAGVGIGLAVSGGDGTPVASAAATLEIVSHPPDGVITIDGRLVGMAPIDRLELDPGRHAVVINLHGYQPYVGTLTIEADGPAALEAHLAPLGAEEATRGTFTGAGKATDHAVPRAAGASATEEAGAAASAAAATEETGAAPTAKTSKRSQRGASKPRRRDCGRERRDCREGCADADRSCTAGCEHCVSCNTNMTRDECNRICKTCRDSCERIKESCRSGCESRHNSCDR